LVSQQHEFTLVSQLLVLLDGLEERGKVVVIATTNRIEAVDPAIRRPGRFDYHIEVPMPDEEGRKAILDTCLSGMKKSRELERSRTASVSRIASLSQGFSGADLAALCREAGLVAIKAGIAAGLDSANVAVGERDLIAAFEAICQKQTSRS
jgi:transitional endoplasmic reticulum ATPase